MQVNTIKLIGGSRDGEVIEVSFKDLPDVISNGGGYHVFDNKSYILHEVDWETGLAVYVPIQLSHPINNEI